MVKKEAFDDKMRLIAKRLDTLRHQNEDYTKKLALMPELYSSKQDKDGLQSEIDRLEKMVVMQRENTRKPTNKHINGKHKQNPSTMNVI